MSATILTIDDSKSVRLIVSEAFRPFDCEVLEAANAVEGLAIAARQRPDVILLDVTMPGMDGIEMLARLKADPELKTIPVIMLTAEAGRESVFKIAQLGIEGYILKPFRPELVVERVARLIPLAASGAGKAAEACPPDARTLLVVDDKPAIFDQVRVPFEARGWSVEARPQADSALEFCRQVLPDAVLISLSLPHDMGFTLYQMLRAYAKTKDTPLFALSVKTATEEQERAQQAGFSGIITKPIDADHLVTIVTHTLSVATASDCFERRDNALVLTVPGNFTPTLANEIAVRLRPEVVGAVDAGLDKMVIDLSKVQSAKPNLIKLVLAAFKLAEGLSVRHSLVGSRSLCWECHRYEESKHWQFVDSYAEALAELQGKAVTA